MSLEELLELEDKDLKDLESDKKSDKKGFLRNISIEELIDKNKVPLTFVLIGVILVGFGILIYKNNSLSNSSEIEILESVYESDGEKEIVVEVAGAVEEPGVYRFKADDRIDDALVAAGGVSADADRMWMEKVLNRAALLSDGQKIYIPTIKETSGDEQSGVLSANNYGEDQSGSSIQGSGLEKRVNVNTALQKELEELWGIGPVTAQNIIEQRPYSTVEELLSRKILKSNVYERNKDLLTVY